MHGLSSAAVSPGPAPLSAILITRNEEAHIAACLASVAFAAECIVVDSGSTDRTREIAASLGARVVTTDDWPGFGPQKNRALDLAVQPWVLAIDADERVTPQLQREILEALRAPAADAYAIPRRSSYCGQYIAHAGWYPDHVTRLFKRGTARFSDDVVHERVVTQSPPAKLRNDLLHASFADFEAVLDKLDRYSTAGAQRLHAQGKRGSLSRAVASGLWAFIRTYVLKLGFLDGRMGFALAVSNAEGTYYRYLKLWLLQQGERRP